MEEAPYGPQGHLEMPSSDRLADQPTVRIASAFATLQYLLLIVALKCSTRWKTSTIPMDTTTPTNIVSGSIPGTTRRAIMRYLLTNITMHTITSHTNLPPPMITILDGTLQITNHSTTIKCRSYNHRSIHSHQIQAWNLVMMMNHSELHLLLAQRRFGGGRP